MSAAYSLSMPPAQLRRAIGPVQQLAGPAGMGRECTERVGQPRAGAYDDDP